MTGESSNLAIFKCIWPSDVKHSVKEWLDRVDDKKKGYSEEKKAKEKIEF